MRARSIYRSINSSAEFTINGKKQSNGTDISINASAYALEYGLTNKLSLQMMIPFLDKIKLTVDYKNYLNSKLYRRKVDESVDTLAKELVGKGICSNQQQCKEYILAGGSIPARKNLV